MKTIHVILVEGILHSGKCSQNTFLEFTVYLWCTALCSPRCLTDTVFFSASLLVGAAPSAVVQVQKQAH